MNEYQIIAFMLTLAVAISYINHRFVKMQSTIAIMFGSITISICLLILAAFGLSAAEDRIAQSLSHINFHDLLINGMLSFLLFAGALNVDVSALLEQKWEILILAIVGTIVSTFLIGGLIYEIFHSINDNVTLLDCLLFGALISPTDPIAVLAMCKEIKASRQLSVIIAGESLFNDGVGIVIFITLYSIATSHQPVNFASVGMLFLQQSIGGIIYGIILGYFAYWLLKPIDDYKMEILITIAIATGGYSLAQLIGVSGPLAMVVAGIFIGNSGAHFKLPKKMSNSLFHFWELIDEILNAILFLLIGFELLLVNISKDHILAGLISIPIVLLVRFLVVGIPLSVFKIWKSYTPHVIKIMTWGGLRGGLAVALALVIPQGHGRDFILTMTYAVVVFSILIQGMTVKSLVKLSKQ